MANVQLAFVRKKGVADVTKKGGSKCSAGLRSITWLDSEFNEFSLESPDSTDSTCPLGWDGFGLMSSGLCPLSRPPLVGCVPMEGSSSSEAVWCHSTGCFFSLGLPLKVSAGK